MTGIIIHWDFTICQEHPKIFFLVQGVNERFFQFGAAAILYNGFILSEVCEENIHQWLYHYLTLFQPFFRCSLVTTVCASSKQRLQCTQHPAMVRSSSSFSTV